MLIDKAIACKLIAASARYFAQMAINIIHKSFKIKQMKLVELMVDGVTDNTNKEILHAMFMNLLWTLEAKKLVLVDKDEQYSPNLDHDKPPKVQLGCGLLGILVNQKLSVFEYPQICTALDACLEMVMIRKEVKALDFTNLYHDEILEYLTETKHLLIDEKNQVKLGSNFDNGMYY